MSTIRPLPYHVFDDLGRLCGRTYTAEGALHLVAALADGAYVAVYHRNKPTVTVWTKGAEQAMSLDDATCLMRERAS